MNIVSLYNIEKNHEAEWHVMRIVSNIEISAGGIEFKLEILVLANIVWLEVEFTLFETDLFWFSLKIGIN